MKSIHQQKIERFMRKIPQTVRDKPGILTDTERILRAKLIYEEAMETLEGLGIEIKYDLKDLGTTFEIFKEMDLIAVADGCADLSVVTIGTLSACGIADLALLDEIDSANLRKFDGPRCVQCDSEMILIEHLGTWECMTAGELHPTKPKEDGPYLRDDGKWVKSKDFIGPNVARVLSNQRFGS